jgi:hypothetical protein
VREQRVLDSLGGRLAVPADHDDRVLERVYRDGDAVLVLGQAPLLDEVGSAHDVGVGQAGLVDPDAAAQDEAVLVAVEVFEMNAVPALAELIDAYNELCMEYIADQGFGLFFHTRRHL